MPDTKYDEGDFISAAEAPTFPSAAVITTTIQLQPGLQRAVNPEHPLLLKFNPREISEKAFNDSTQALVCYGDFSLKTTTKIK